MNSNQVHCQNGDMESKELKQQLSEIDTYDEDMSIDEMKKCMCSIRDSENQVSNSNFNSTNNFSSPTNESEEMSLLSRSRIDKQFPKAASREIKTSQIFGHSYENKSSYSERYESNESIFDSSRTPNDNSSIDSSCVRKTLKDSSSRLSQSLNVDHDTNTTVSHFSNIPDFDSYSYRVSHKKIETSNILDCKVLSYDLPLKTRFTLKPRQKNYMIDGVLKIPDEILAKKNAFLTKMANLAYEWKAKSICREPSWGAPIKVCVVNRNDPQLTKCQAQNITRESNSSTHLLLSTLIQSKDDIDSGGKRKHEKVSKVVLNKLETLPQHRLETNEHRDASKEKIDIEVARKMVDHDEVHNNRERVKSPTSEYQEESTFPRSIIPPNPFHKIKSKEKNSTIADRPKKRSAVDVEKKIVKSMFSSTNEQIENCISNDEQFESTNSMILLPTKRLSQSTETLKRARLSHEKQKKIQEEKVKSLAEQEARAKEERVELRKKEREAEKQERETQEKIRKDREDRYRNLTNISSRYTAGTFQKRTELESEGVSSQRHIHLSHEEKINRPLPASEKINMFSNKNDNTERIKDFEESECPICRKQFPLSQIENHASNCNDFVQDDGINITASTSNSLSSSAGIFTCQTCFYHSSNELIFKQHMFKCPQSLSENDIKTKDAAPSNSSSRRPSTSTQDFEMEIDEDQNFSNSKKKKRHKTSKTKRKR